MKALASVLAFALPFSAAVAAAELPLQVDPAKSILEIAAHATGHSFTGKVTSFQATLSADPATHHITHAQVVARFANLKTQDDKRDAEMLKWENADQFPEITFQLTGLEPVDATHFKATGSLNLHGKAQPVSFPAVITYADSSALYTVDGDAVVNTLDFGLPIIRKFAIAKVSPEVKVHFHLLAQASSK